MAMYKSLFDLSPEQTASTAMPRTVVFSNGTGSGSMTICPLFSGAELYYNDMHLFLLVFGGIAIGKFNYDNVTEVAS